VVYATEGYPGSYAKGSVISNLDAANSKVPLHSPLSVCPPLACVVGCLHDRCAAPPAASGRRSKQTESLYVELAAPLTTPRQTPCESADRVYQSRLSLT
jgi:hypothetical protein